MALCRRFAPLSERKKNKTVYAMQYSSVWQHLLRCRRFYVAQTCELRRVKITVACTYESVWQTIPSFIAMNAVVEERTSQIICYNII